jgi:GT2 family glycosyltransferase
MEYENIAADTGAVAAAERLLRSSLVNRTHLVSIIGHDDPYPEELLDCLQLVDRFDQLAVLCIFDREYYVATNPDVAASAIDPLVHFLTVGVAESRSPHPLIDLHYIVERRRDLYIQNLRLSELIEAIERNLCDPSPYFSIEDYVSNQYILDASETSALLHYLSIGAEARARPNNFFDPAYYAARFDDVPGTALDATLHFIGVGDRQGRQPSAEFDPVWYWDQYGDTAGYPPLLHFLSIGRGEGRLPRNTAPPSAVTVLAEVAAENCVPHEDAAVMLERYERLKRKLEAVGHERRSRFRTHDACPVYLDEPDEALELLQFPAVGARGTSRRPRTAAATKIDILIPTFNEFEYLVECLESIRRAGIATSYRVIVADDASTDPRLSRLSQVPGLVYLTNKENLNFLRNCNAAFASVTAEYLLLLNNDVQLMPGAIDRLVQVLDDDDEVAAAAPMVLYPNGRLQEAGCAVRADGTSVMVGVGEDPLEPGYNYRRPVQYSSAACLLVRRSALDGKLFDEHYAPLYCEDVDLCMRLRARGFAIIYEPAARVIHHLSVSANRQSNTRRLQRIVRNQAKLVQRWGQRLEVDAAARVLAFYLPQFHPIAQNDRWWGKGFTEWTNVVRARPSFAGHYQPHLPADLGFYDLRLAEVMGEQQRLARRYGVEGFIVYYYNFGGQRILEAPMENLLLRPEIDFRFALCWANENWTRHWDGGSGSVILAQSYDPATIAAVAADAIRFAADPRALMVNGKPLFLIYRPLLLPDPVQVTGMLRQRFAEAGFPGVHLVYVESMELLAAANTAPAELGFDAAVEFPPQGIASPVMQAINPTKLGFEGRVYDYEATVLNALNRPRTNYTRYPAVFASWDNTARQPLKGTTLHGASPELFQAYVEGKLDEVERFTLGDERLLFVNAWNEWAEGAHLEPDQAYGHRWLAAIRAALVHKGMFR